MPSRIFHLAGQSSVKKSFEFPDLTKMVNVHGTKNILDACLKRVLDSLKKINGEALITADHGNIELMFDEKTQQPHTAHTTNLVPLIYVGRPAKVIAKTGALDDVAPTLLYLMGLEKPAEMTGNILFQTND